MHVEQEERIQLFLLKFSANIDSYLMRQLSDKEVWSVSEVNTTPHFGPTVGKDQSKHTLTFNYDNPN